MKIRNCFTGLATLILGLHAGSSLAGPSVSVGHAVGDWEIDGAITDGEIAMTSVALAWPVGESGALSVKYGTSSEKGLTWGSTPYPNDDLELDDITLTYSNSDYFIGYQELEVVADFITGEISGLFIGGSGSSDSGFYYSAAVALVDADFSGNGVEFEAEYSLGLSIGLGYAQALSDNLVWSADYKYQNYWFDWDVEQSGDEESMIQSTFGLTLKYSQ